MMNGTASSATNSDILAASKSLIDNENTSANFRKTNAGAEGTIMHVIEHNFTDLYHPKVKPPSPPDAYKDRIAEVENTMKTTLDTVNMVEEHIRGQYLQAKRNDESFYATKRETDPTKREAILPIGLSTLTVDDGLLQSQHLLNARETVKHLETTQLSKTLVVSDSVVDVIPDPGYLKTTASFQSHIIERPLPGQSESLIEKVATLTASMSPKAAASSSPVAKDELANANATTGSAGGSESGGTAQQKKEIVYNSADKIDIPSILMRNFRFLKNPRYRSQPPNFREMLQDNKEFMVDADGLIEETKYLGPKTFLAIPSVVRFSDYEVGLVFEQPLQIQNAGAVMGRVRVIPPASSFFSVSLLQYPNPDGLIAPGMYCQCMIRFHPDTLADFEDVLTVMTETGKFMIPLIARRKPPNLTLSDTVDCGSCFVNDLLAITIPCKNLGGAGKFLLIPDDEWPDPPDNVHFRQHVDMQPFRVQPASLVLEPGDSVDVRIEFAPPKAGKFSCGFRLVCDNCAVQRYTLMGSAFDPWVALKALDEQPVAPPNIPPPTVVPVELHFQPTGPGSICVKKLKYQNASPLPLSFSWIGKNIPTPHTRSIAFKKRWGANEMPAVFSMEPCQGTFQPSAVIDFELKFRPVDTVACKAQFELFLEGLPCADKPALLRSHIDIHAFAQQQQQQQQSSPNPSGPGFGSGGATFEDRVVGKLVVDGVGEPCNVEIQPQIIVIPGDLSIGRIHNRTITIVNSQAAVAEFDWESYPDMIHQAVRVRPATGSLQPGERKELEVLCSPKTTGFLDVLLHCSISFGQPLTLRFQANITGPSLSVKEASLDLGLVQLGKPMKGKLTLINTCDVCARWSMELIEDPSQLQQQQGKDEEQQQQQHQPSLQLQKPQPQPPKRHSELSFSPSSGALEPGSSCVITTTLNAKTCRRLRGVTVCKIEGGKTLFVETRAEIQQPKACLSESISDLGAIFVKVPRVITITCKNLTLIPTKLTWDQNPYTVKKKNDDDDDGPIYTVKFHPSVIQLGPLAEAITEISITGTDIIKSNRLETFLVADVEGMKEPLGLLIKASIMGLVVSYHAGLASDLPPLDPHMLVEHDDEASSSKRDDGNHDQPIALDFGSGKMNNPRVKTFVLRNHSGIAAPFHLEFDRYGAEDPDARAEDRQVTKSRGSSTATRRGKDKLTMTFNANEINTHRSKDRELFSESVPALTKTSASIAFGAAADSSNEAEKAIRNIRMMAPFLEDGAECLSAALRIGHPQQQIAKKQQLDQKMLARFAKSNSNNHATTITSKHDAASKEGTSTITGKHRRPLLSNDHEISGKFRSPHGKFLIDQRSLIADQAQVLSSGQGIAFVASQTSGILGAWEDIEFNIVMLADMCGSFTDTLRCTVQGLPTKVIPVSAVVLGEPVFLEGGTLGLNLKNDPASLSWGTVLRKSQPVNRTLRVSNTSPHEMQVRWKILEKAPPTEKTGLVTVEAVVGADGKVKINLIPIVAPEVPSGVGPFSLSCETLLIPPHSTMAMNIACAWPEVLKETTHHLMGVVSKVHEGEHEDSEEEEEQDGGGINDDFIAPIHVAMQARVASAVLDADNTKKLRFVCFTSDAPDHASYHRSITFTNREKMSVDFSMRVATPFSIVNVASTTPVLKSGQKFDGTTKATTPGTIQSGTGTGTQQQLTVQQQPQNEYTLPSGYCITVGIRFTPPAKHRSRVVEDAKFNQDLIISFTNGEEQRFPLEALLYHPEIQTNVSELEFAVNHVDSVKTLTIVLTNPTYSDAQWSVVHQPAVYQTSNLMETISTTTTTKKEPAYHDDPTRFTFEPECGVIPGRGRRPEIPATATVQVKFQAAKNVSYSSQFRFILVSGRGCTVTLKGRGSYDEQDDGGG